MQDNLKAVISGSYRKHLSALYAHKHKLGARKIRILSLFSESAINPRDDFVILDAGPLSDPRTLQDAVCTKIRASSFLTVCNIDGCMGSAALMEIGYAIPNGIQIRTLEPVKDPNIAPYTRNLSKVFDGPLLTRIEL